MQLNKILLRIIKQYFLLFKRIFLVFDLKKIKIDDKTKYQKYSSEIGVVIQGPINYENNFTLEAAKFLKSKYPNILIVLSTWQSENQKSIHQFQEHGIKCLETKLPENRGVKNINLQVLSTTVGLKFLKKSGCKYVLKIRTDQILFTTKDFVGFFLDLTNYFSLKKLAKGHLNQKLIISSLNTFKERYYGVSDMLMFGQIDDMEKYWCPEFDLKKNKDIVVENENRFFMRQATAEGYLISEFMKKIDYKPKWTNNDHRKFMSKYFVVFNYNSLGHFWFKNNWWFENNQSNQFLSFGEWFSMYVDAFKTSQQ